MGKKISVTLKLDLCGPRNLDNKIIQRRLIILKSLLKNKKKDKFFVMGLLYSFL